MKDLKLLLLFIAGYLLVFVELPDIQQILFSVYYFVTDLINPAHVMPDVYGKILSGIAILIVFMLFMESTIGRK